MVDIIIVLIVIVLLGFALKGSTKHFKGESPCCGGGGGEIVLDIPDKKLENPILGKKVLKISGMHCEHCVKAVTEAINKIDGAAAKVNLSENEAPKAEINNTEYLKLYINKKNDNESLAKCFYKESACLSACPTTCYIGR